MQDQMEKLAYLDFGTSIDDPQYVHLLNKCWLKLEKENIVKDKIKHFRALDVKAEYNANIKTAEKLPEN